MPNIFHQSVEEILKAATPEQRLLWNDIFLKFGERCAISQYVFTGLLGGSRFASYTARRIFVSYECVLTTNFPLTATSSNLAIYDENNAAIYSAGNLIPVWDVTAAAMRYIQNPVDLNNIYFSRIVQGSYLWIKFIGYMVNY